MNLGAQSINGRSRRPHRHLSSLVPFVDHPLIAPVAAWQSAADLS
jgi:hypothetical protein